MGGIYERRGTYVFLASDSWAKTWGWDAQAEGEEKTPEKASTSTWMGGAFGDIWILLVKGHFLSVMQKLVRCLWLLL